MGRGKDDLWHLNINRLKHNWELNFHSSLTLKSSFTRNSGNHEYVYYSTVQLMNRQSTVVKRTIESNIYFQFSSNETDKKSINRSNMINVCLFEFDHQKIKKNKLFVRFPSIWCKLCAESKKFATDWKTKNW